MSPLFSLGCLALWSPLWMWFSCGTSFDRRRGEKACLPSFLATHHSPPMNSNPCCGGALGPAGFWCSSCENVSACCRRSGKGKRNPWRNVERAGGTCQRKTPLRIFLRVQWFFDDVDLQRKHTITRVHHKGQKILTSE